MDCCILPATTNRVALNTCKEINEQIRERTLHCLSSEEDRSESALSEKIKALNEEWDTERVLETGAASLVLAASIMGYLKSGCRCFWITGAVGGFLLQHALQGWCPPLPVIRKCGVRTAEEINNEKMVLKLLRGDFASQTGQVDDLLSMAEKQ